MVYVDDILIIGSSTTQIDAFVSQLHLQFTLKDMDSLHYFFLVKVSYSKNVMHFFQHKYMSDLLSATGLDDAKLVIIPMVSTKLLSKVDGIPMAYVTKYRQVVGSLQYLILTMPYISFHVNKYANFCPLLLRCTSW